MHPLSRSASPIVPGLITEKAVQTAAIGAATLLGLMTLIPADAARADEKASISGGPAVSELTAAEREEREARKACKIEICRAFRNPGETAGGDIACKIPKSWRKSQLDKMVSKAKTSWPWGPVLCQAEISVARGELASAMREAKYELKLKPHHVACTVKREKKDDAEIDVHFSPTVTFEKGKAVKAKINWGKLTAPTLIKGAMWTATATDNTFNVLQSTLVEDINDFISKKCDEVKEEWSKPAP